MAIYHLSMQVISANKGKTAIASASYRSGEQLHSEKEDKNYYYKREVLPETFILKPENAPDWSLDRERLWNEVEKVEKAKNARYAREMNIALPEELSNDEQKKLILSYCQETFVNDGMVADIAIHRDDEGNPHAHIMLTQRPFNDDGSWGAKSKKIYILDDKGNKIYNPKNRTYKCYKERTTNWDSKETLNHWRKEWARFANQSLKENGIDEEISHLSYEDQGIDKQATRHEGYGEKGEENKKLNQQAKEVNQLKEKLARKEEEIKTANNYNLLTNELSDKDKERLKDLSQSLKTYVNITNIEDKKRMLNNWKTSAMTKELLGEEQTKIFSTISGQEKDILQADKILIEASKKLIEKNYPYINMDNLLDDEIKNIADLTIKKGNPLLEEEIQEEIQNFRPHLLEKQVLQISKEPYISYLNLQSQIDKKSKILNKVLAKYDQSISTIGQVKNPKELFGKDLKNIQILSKEITRAKLAEKTINTFYNTFLDKVFPNADTNIPIERKEEIYRIVTYLNPKHDEISVEKMDSWLENTPRKFSNKELELGLKIIEGKEFISMTTNQELKRILESYPMKAMFLNECLEENSLNKNRIESLTEKINQEQKQLTEERREFDPDYKNIVYKPDTLSNRLKNAFPPNLLINLFGSKQTELERKKRNSKFKKLQKTMQSKNTLHR